MIFLGDDFKMSWMGGMGGMGKGGKNYINA